MKVLPCGQLIARRSLFRGGFPKPASSGWNSSPNPRHVLVKMPAVFREIWWHTRCLIGRRNTGQPQASAIPGELTMST